MARTQAATCLDDVVNWTLGDGKQLRLRELIPGFCERLIEAGMPVLRGSVHIRQLHPQYYGRGFFGAVARRRRRNHHASTVSNPRRTISPAQSTGSLSTTRIFAAAYSTRRHPATFRY